MLFLSCVCIEDEDDESLVAFDILDSEEIIEIEIDEGDDAELDTWTILRFVEFGVNIVQVNCKHDKRYQKIALKITKIINSKWSSLLAPS